MSALASRIPVRGLGWGASTSGAVGPSGWLAAAVTLAWLVLAAFFFGGLRMPGPTAVSVAAVAAIPVTSLLWSALGSGRAAATARVVAVITGTLGAATVAATAIAAEPLVALAIPALAVTAVVLGRFPAAGVLLAFAISGSYGSLIAFWSAPTASVTQLALGGLWLATIWKYLLSGRQQPAWLWPGTVVLGAYLALTAASFVVAEDRYVAVESFLESGWYMLAFLLVAYAGWSAKTHGRIARGIVVIAFLVGAYATLRWLIGPADAEREIAGATQFNFVGGELRTVGSFPSGQELGGWTAVAIPFCVAFGLDARGRWRALAAAGAVLCMVGLLASEFRTALLAVILGTALVVGLYQAARAVPGLGIGRTALAGFASAAVAASVFALTGGSSDPETHGYSVIVNPTTEDPSVAARVYKWEQALEDLEGHPFGYGVGTASFIGREHNRFVLHTGQFDVDNGYLKLALEQGLPIMAVFIVGLALLMGGLVRRTLITTDRQRATIAAGATGALVAFSVQMASVTFADGPRALAAWLIIGLGVAQFAVAQRGPTERASPR